MNVWITVAAFFLTASTHAAAQERFVSKLTLSTGQKVVVAEGDFEARSTGGFSVRLYAVAEAPNETAFFVDDLIRPRDGFIEKIILTDIDGDKIQEITVAIRSAGAGSYLSAQAFSVAKDKLIFRAAVDGLAADADPVITLRKSRQF